MSELRVHPAFDVRLFADARTFGVWAERAPRIVPIMITPDSGSWVRCTAVAGHREWTYEKHHLRPKAWGGPVPLRMDGLHQVWEPVCANCHNAIHLTLDEAMRTGKFPTRIWCSNHRVSYNRRQLAHRGWVLHLEAINRKEVPAPAWWPADHDVALNGNGGH